MPQKHLRVKNSVFKLGLKQKIVLAVSLCSVLLLSLGISFASNGTSRYSSSFNSRDSQVLKGATKNSDGSITFSNPTSPTTTAPSTNVDLFDRNQYIVTDSWTGGGLPDPSGDSDAAFRTNCHPSHLGYVDPIVSPGGNGASHLHMFYGNKKTDHNSTATSLKNTGMGSCDGGPLNRTGYWIPAMMASDSTVALPETTVIYYKTPIALANKAIAMPEGLRMIAGNGMAHSVQSDGHTFYKFKCVDNNGNGRTIFDNQLLIGSCPANSRLYMNFFFPQCWDGRLDSPDHKSHLTYLDWGATSCPSSHPQLLPQVSINLGWDTGSSNTSNWYLSSDDMTKMGMGRMPGGTTAHGDWFMAWDSEVNNQWFKGCLQNARSCNGGQLGNGKNLKRISVNYPGPLLVPKPTSTTTLTPLSNSGLQG